ncbi:hypothetical protein B2J93_2085 [Marssonina coronariae]|uniref:Domain of unknown function at the cortex 1 domain-containing protein n=1 Tax=Diplocarpon coronariae TaxID=2795749 RepID=A0A218Z7N2_9HELO|nr:hypothetical protein B2J93_2085 [Marssonina coronariae]
MAQKYVLRVTAGPGYETTTHQVVPVNDARSVTIDTEHINVDLNVRIQSYRGLPKTSSTTSPYFDLPPHDKNQDQYSIAFRFQPKTSINGDDLVFGNDFDHPIRDRLPPGFSTAFRIVKWAIDPGLDGDVYADKPYLYGPAASSVNRLHVGSKGGRQDIGEHEAGLVFEEGGDAEGRELRWEQGVPDTEAARKKHFLHEDKRKGWEWEEGRVYGCDFYNPYLDFNGLAPRSLNRLARLTTQPDFALRLPGFTLPIMNYWDGQGLRYTLKNRKTDTVLFVVLFTLYLKEDVDEDGNVKAGVEAGKPFDRPPKRAQEQHEQEKTVAGEQLAAGGKENEQLPETSADDVD